MKEIELEAIFKMLNTFLYHPLVMETKEDIIIICSSGKKKAMSTFPFIRGLPYKTNATQRTEGRLI